MSARPPVACLHLAPWPLTLLARQHPSVPVAVLAEGSRRVTLVDALAAEAGVQPGMREAAALSRCPELHAEVVPGPAAQAAWNELLELLYARFSDRVDGTEPGVAFLALGSAGARELATALHASVGVAGSREVAQLAALHARPGEVREVAGTGGKGEALFLDLTPLSHLHVLGLDAAHAQRLAFLGLRGLADLRAWSAGQREAFLGVEVSKRLNRFLRGDRRTDVGRYAPGQVVGASLSVDTPLMEPGEADAALADLLPTLWAELRGRSCTYLTVQAVTPLGSLTATRSLKWPLDFAGLQRLAYQAILSTDALPMGVEKLTVQLSGLAQPSRMVGLWAGLAELEVTRAVLDRFPEALVRVEWLDPYAYAADAQYRWVDWQTGAPRITPLTPPKFQPGPKGETHADAVNRVLAFFEGVQP